MISGKGGVGKTSLSVNLGISLSKLGNEVTVVDTDFSASNLGVHLGRYDHPVKVQHVLEGEDDPENAVFRHPSGIKAMVASNEIRMVEPDEDEIEEILNHAREISDYVLVDCPPGLNSTVENIMMACDELMILTMPTQSSGINAAQIIERAKELRIPVLGTIVNMAEEDPEMELVDREVEMMTESHIMATIPRDKEVKKSLFENSPLVTEEPLSEAALEIQALAHRLDGKEFEKPKFASLKRNMKKVKNALTR